jgi:hypothetical protein
MLLDMGCRPAPQPSSSEAPAATPVDPHCDGSAKEEA